MSDVGIIYVIFPERDETKSVTSSALETIRCFQKARVARNNSKEIEWSTVIYQNK